jgi:hypothetical protein
MRLDRSIVLTLALLFVFGTALAQPQDPLASQVAAYRQVSITRYLEMFSAQDVDRSDGVTREEAQGNIEFVTVFNDMDINRDGLVTRAELVRHLSLQFGYEPPK